jgi:hypothetical protein
MGTYRITGVKERRPAVVVQKVFITTKGFVVMEKRLIDWAYSNLLSVVVS